MQPLSPVSSPPVSPCPVLPIAKRTLLLLLSLLLLLLLRYLSREKQRKMILVEWVVRASERIEAQRGC